jgi:beta-galactosidase
MRLQGKRALVSAVGADIRSMRQRYAMRSTIAIAIALLALLPIGVPAADTTPHFAIQGEHFLLDGTPYVIRAGEMHYPRIPHEHWRDRLRKAHAMGLNTILTYVFWNQHEPEPGQWDFSGDRDVAAFVRTAREEGLNVVLRPGPYVCAEDDFGGFPAWLLRTPGLRVRSIDPRFLAASARYFKRIAQELAPLQSTRGGPILMVQVENEYGSYDSDHDYMQAIKRQIVDAGFDAPLFTADGPQPRMLERGTLPDVTPVINVDGSPEDIERAFQVLAKFRQNIPRMVGEYYPGWFDHWGEQHHTRGAEQSAKAIDWMLAHDISFSLYMFHGGTNFGFMAGANYNSKEPYQPDATSYDYDAPVDEAGHPTPKYFALREAIRKHLPAGETLPEVPANIVETIAIPRFELRESAALLEMLTMLGKPVESELPRSMEELGQNYGFVLYRKRLDRALNGRLRIDEVRDYAMVLADGAILGTLDRRRGEKEMPVALKSDATLDLLVENMGRINFAPKLVDEHKGITHTIALSGDDEITGWQMWPLPLDDLAQLKFRHNAKRRAPAFWRASFDLGKTADTFLDTRGWGKGHVWVNGHHLGRYWKIGPQQTLYLPAPWLRKGRNEVIVLELEDGTQHSLQGLTAPVYATAADGPRPAANQ